VEAWAKDYGHDGFEVVGVHTPEYAFEHVPANVEAGAKRLGLTFPIALDNSYTTWNAYDNQSWPASYLIDAQGVVRHVSIGEGGYSEDESLVRQLLDAAHPGGTLPPPTEVADTTPDDPAQTPETYLGAEREQYYGGAGPYTTGHFDITGHLAVNKYALSGNWKIGRESITSGDGAAITLLYHASRVYLDTGGRGTLTVTTGDATKVINVSGAPDIFTVASTPSAANGLVTIHLSPGLSAYSFTFG
jgi:hypothetical protein